MQFRSHDTSHGAHRADAHFVGEVEEAQARATKHKF